MDSPKVLRKKMLATILHKPTMVADVPKREDVPQRLTNQWRKNPRKGKIWRIC